jgi:nucleoside-diphosphate-sugar epimerase
MGQKVLVTGGAGYVGSVLCEHLLDAGYQVSVIDNLAYKQNSLFHLCNNAHLDFVRGDVRDEYLMHRLINYADMLIPLAAVVGAPACDQDPWLAKSLNVYAIRLLSRLRSPRQVVVYPQRTAVMGQSQKIPTAPKKRRWPHLALRADGAKPKRTY